MEPQGMAAPSPRKGTSLAGSPRGIREEFRQGTPPAGHVDTETIRINGKGLWLADDREITHEPTVRLFSRSIRRDEKGYFLHIGQEYKRIEVEDTAFFVLRAQGSAEEGYDLLLSDETWERLDPATLIYRPERLVCRIKGGEEEAKFLNPAYLDLLKDLREDGHWYFLVLEGKRMDLARTS